LLAYSSSRQCARTNAAALNGVIVFGGVIVSSNETCTQGSGVECSGLLTSSDVGLFYSSLGIISKPAQELEYYFEHSVDFCKLDAPLLAALISKESLDFFGEQTYA